MEAVQQASPSTFGEHNMVKILKIVNKNHFLNFSQKLNKKLIFIQSCFAVWDNDADPLPAPVHSAGHSPQQPGLQLYKGYPKWV
jgi:hypothetical protein